MLVMQGSSAITRTSLRIISMHCSIFSSRRSKRQGGPEELVVDRGVDDERSHDDLLVVFFDDLVRHDDPESLVEGVHEEVLASDGLDELANDL